MIDAFDVYSLYKVRRFIDDAINKKETTLIFARTTWEEHYFLICNICLLFEFGEWKGMVVI